MLTINRLENSGDLNNPSPVCDLIGGNIPGVVSIDDAETVVVSTRAQVAAYSKSKAPLRVPVLPELQISCSEVFTRNRDTAVPAEGNGDLQTLICVLVVRPRLCLTLSNPVP